jgi:hypothetical protein
MSTHRFNLPALTLPETMKGSPGRFSDITNYKEWFATDEVTNIIAQHVPDMYMDDSVVMIQEQDATLNDRIYSLGSRWRLRYIIEPAVLTIQTHNLSDDDVTQSYTPEAHTWLLQDAHSRVSNTNINGTVTSILVKKEDNILLEAEKLWIRDHCDGEFSNT